MNTTSFSLTYKPISRNVNIQSISPDDITPASTVQPNMTQVDIDDTIISECIRNSANVLEINLDSDTNNIVIPLTRISAFDFESFDRIHNTGFNYFTTETSSPGSDVSVIVDDDELLDGSETNRPDRTRDTKYDTTITKLFTVNGEIPGQPDLYFRKPDETVYISATVQTNQNVTEIITFTVTAANGVEFPLIYQGIRTLVNGYGVFNLSFHNGEENFNSTSNIIPPGKYTITGYTNITNLIESIDINVI